MKTSHKTRIVTTTCAAILCLGLLWQGEARAWEVLLKEEGITVSGHEEEGRGLPIFRGEGVIEGNLLEVLAVLGDTGRASEWMHSCREAKELKRINATERLVYNRTAAPWPVSDRDVVTHSRAQINGKKKTVTVKFEAVSSPLKPEIEDAVRMPRLKGFYKLQALDEKRTMVTYQVDADPGGLLPDWLAARASRELPLHTLRGLRKQVAKTRGQYEAQIQAWAKHYEGEIQEAMPEAAKQSSP